MEWKRLGWTWTASMIVSLYTTFVLLNLWNWFITPAFNIPSLSYWQMYGITLFVSLFSESGQDFMHEQRWKVILAGLDVCVLESRREELNETIKNLNEEIWGQLGAKIFGRLVGNTITLILAWVVQSFLH